MGRRRPTHKSKGSHFPLLLVSDTPSQRRARGVRRGRPFFSVAGNRGHIRAVEAQAGRAMNCRPVADARGCISAEETEKAPVTRLSRCAAAIKHMISQYSRILAELSRGV